MKKNILITVLFLLCGWELARLHQMSRPVIKPNNQYELLIYQGGYTIMDGSRVVGYFNWENNPKLDSIIKYDNQ
jgi:hypothetical protein